MALTPIKNKRKQHDRITPLKQSVIYYLHKGKRTGFTVLSVVYSHSNEIPNTFSKFYRRHNEMVSKLNVGLKLLLHHGLSEPEFYGDLVYKFKKIRGMTDFADQFRKLIICYKRIGYNLNVMLQSACLIFNPITVDGFVAVFHCTPVDRASDSMMAPT